MTAQHPRDPAPCGPAVGPRSARPLGLRRPTRRGFMTLQLDQAPMEQVLAACRALPGILDARSPQKQELVLEYDPQLLTEADLAILSLLRREQWRYKQLTLGQTLEQQLFDVAG